MRTMLICVRTKLMPAAIVHLALSFLQPNILCAILLRVGGLPCFLQGAPRVATVEAGEARPIAIALSRWLRSRVWFHLVDFLIWLGVYLVTLIWQSCFSANYNLVLQ